MPAPPIPLVSGQRRISRAVVVNADTGFESEAGLVAATVTIDAKSDARRAVDVELTRDVDPALLQAPHRLKLWAGVNAGGMDYWAPLAHVTMGKRQLSPRNVWRVTECHSFEALVAKARFRSPRTLFAGSSMVSNIRQLIVEAVPWADVTVSTAADALIPAGNVSFERERLQAILGREESLATALGVDVGCDGNGTFVIRDLPDLTRPVWELSEGPGGLLIDYTESVSSDDVTNVWVVSTDHPDVAPYTAVVADEDPWSPTRVSRYGERVGFFSSPLLGGPDQCASAGRTRLSNSRGLTVALSMTSVTNPWADITEAVSSVRSGVKSIHVLDRLQVSVRAQDTMSVTAAARTVAVS